MRTDNRIPRGLFTKAVLKGAGMTESEIAEAIRQNHIIMRRDGTMLRNRYHENSEIPAGTAVVQVKDQRKRRLQVVKKNGSKYSVVDPETKKVEEVDERDIAIDDSGSDQGGANTR